MVGVAISQQLRAFHSSLQLPSLKMSSSSSSSSSSSLTKTLIRTLFTSQLRRLTRVLTTARSFLVEVFSKRSSSSSSSPPVHFFIYFTRNKKNKIHFGSFRMHYNWCSSRSWSVPASVLTELPAAAGAADSQRHAYYDATWQCEADPAAGAESHRHAYYDATWQFEEVVGGGDLYNDPSELSGYLRWLEEKKVANNAVDDGGARNEIDELADMFIAQCREKFILEKQESERKFREMLARSM